MNFRTSEPATQKFCVGMIQADLSLWNYVELLTRARVRPGITESRIRRDTGADSTAETAGSVQFLQMVGYPKK
jgi:hypothetical protein